MSSTTKTQGIAGLSQIAKPPDTSLKASPQEIATLFQDLKSGKELTDIQHAVLEKALNVAAEREPAMVAQVAFKQEIYSGPLPHHDQLNGYDEETRREIVGMAVREQTHAHQMQSAGLSGAIWKDRTGQIFALIVAITGLAAASWVAQYSAWASAIIGSVDLLGLVCAFIAPRVLERTPDSASPPAAEKKRPQRKK